jgi:hypothetical protein
MLFIGGDPLAYAGFQDRESCEQVRRIISPHKDITHKVCVRSSTASAISP